MECPEGQLPISSENDSTPTVSTSEVTSQQEPQIPVDRRSETTYESSADIAGDQGTQIPADEDAQTDADSSAQAAAQAPENFQEGKDMSESQDEVPDEVENQFILRLPLEHACTVRNLARSQSVKRKDKLKIDLLPDGRHAVVEVEDVPLAAKLVDLPCVIESLRTLDKKTFYKTADISQMLVCTADGDIHLSPEEPAASTDPNIVRKKERGREEKCVWKHGITPPLKNVRKKRFRKTQKKVPDVKEMEKSSFTKYIESPDVENEVKRLLRSDAEAVSTRWEVIAEDGTKEIESQGSIPGFVISSGMSSHKQGHTSSEYDMLREMFSDSRSNNDDEDEDDEDEDEDEDKDKEEEEEDCSEEYLERQLQAEFIESGQYRANEGTSSIVTEIQKQIEKKEKKLHKIQNKAQRQKDLIMKVENLTLKNHFQSVLEQLELQEKQKNEKLISLQEQLQRFLKK
ncbi:TAF7L isoform 1 [Pan troglodytes]|uniref:TATA-box binding protein associated factor 7 like n=3 Tax=Pan TaxID=9596 RepID=A0A2I3STA2_PANTR|nr:transcription initiation factor TFIID subunit 7-like isoform X4 [Pan paniscus]XP_016799606.1 transcription initiation factor TFIID subunit 7-like isoform X4 [Pan troglodytes]PNI11355.1 TAF7L isoform 1 [Pan troglodytes]